MTKGRQGLVRGVDQSRHTGVNNGRLTWTKFCSLVAAREPHVTASGQP